MNELLMAAIAGVVEGITEILPVSVTGHMALFEFFFGFNGESAKIIALLIQWGAILSVGFLYQDEYLKLMKPAAWFHKPVGLSVWHVAVGMAPTGLVAFAARSLIRKLSLSSFSVIIGLLLGAFIMLAAEKISDRTDTTDVEKITLLQAFIIGLFQVLSLWPGISRACSAISGGLFAGLDRKTAADFSFITAVPLMTVICFLDLEQSWSRLTIAELQMVAVGFVVAFAAAYFSATWFLRFLSNSTLTAFAYYRIVLAGFSYYYFFGH